MSHSPSPTSSLSSGAGPSAGPSTYEATVVAVEGPLSLRVRAAADARMADAGGLLARVATAGPYRAQVGDEVLITEGEGGRRYVIGVLRALRERSEPEAPALHPALRMEEGSSARLEAGEGGEEVLRVRDRSGALLFEHRGDRSELFAPAGDLILAAPRGEVRIEAGAGVRVRAEDRVELESARGLRLRSGEEGEEASALELTPLGLTLSLKELALDARRADLVFGEARVFGERLKSTVRKASQRFLKLEQQSELMIQRAGSLYREVEGLEQSRAGRIKLFAKEALKQVAKSVSVRAERDVSVDGEKIYLG